MKPLNAITRPIAALLLFATTACVVVPFGDGHGGGERRDDRGGHGSSEHARDLRGAGHWNDAGDATDHKQSALDSDEMTIANSEFLRPAVYVYYIVGTRQPAIGFWE